jgi:hypothetical protein
MTDTQVAIKGRWPVALIASGAVLTALGIVASAIATRVALTSGKVLISSKADPLALAFPPPDYAATWAWIVVAAVGVVVAVAGVAANRSRRAVAD